VAPGRRQQIGEGGKASLTAAQHPNLTGNKFAYFFKMFSTTAQHPCSEHKGWFSHSTANNLSLKRRTRMSIQNSCLLKSQMEIRETSKCTYGL
jgi:hypothetical protein